MAAFREHRAQGYYRPAWIRVDGPAPARVRLEPRSAARSAPPCYPGHVEVRRVSNCGARRLHSGQIFLSQTLNGESIGLEQVQDGLWNILYYDNLLGRFDERTKTTTGAPSLRGQC